MIFEELVILGKHVQMGLRCYPNRPIQRFVSWFLKKAQTTETISDQNLRQLGLKLASAIAHHQHPLYLEYKEIQHLQRQMVLQLIVLIAPIAVCIRRYYKQLTLLHFSKF
ncbi:MAG: hypothetical protein EZS28_000823 [Streblomastix strix]|uniref:Uncharacterized protein n=1 Tax=Streblomastix strix TaxID=222440 RepID=A0A5J4X8S5_9EUKA|nr:MAG: hypothetical protein EZS28_000823 [Streblomastix strix]